MRLPAINMSEGELQRFDESLEREWIVSNGLGGYASSTILGLNTRKYHGLLVAALKPPANRTVCVAKLDDEALTENAVYPLNSNEFKDTITPQGHKFLRSFSIAPFPKYSYATEVVQVEKTVFMAHGKNAAIALYKVSVRDQRAAFRIYPVLNFRHFHSVTEVKSSPELLQSSDRSSVEVESENPEVTVALSATEGEFKKRPTWIERLFYRAEAERGESSFDDGYQPGYFEIQLLPLQTKEFAIVSAAEEENTAALSALEAMGKTTEAVRSLLEKETASRNERVLDSLNRSKKAGTDGWLWWILQAADSFIVESGNKGRAIIAGYHWFEPWGRDTFISLPGLVLATGRFEDARRIILEFTKHIKDGLIPNFIGDKSRDRSYNTVDSTLWYINAVLQYALYTNDFEFIQRKLWERLKTIVECHINGTSYGIRLDGDGLLIHGPQLTWMDSQIDGKAVTPREGKAVEIQALWHNSLRTMQLLANKFGEETLAQTYSDMAAKAKGSFNRKFWNTQKGCLFDTVGQSGVDLSLRPNQVIAASLRYPIIDEVRARIMLNTVHQELVTPCGLRTLAAFEPNYVGSYVGDRRQRDMAYHNGTVWPWLLGPFATAYLKAESQGGLGREWAFKSILNPLLSKQVFQAGLGTISEVFDGDSPHTPRGCISQAWSVAEPLRAYIEDVLQIRPRYEDQMQLG